MRRALGISAGSEVVGSALLTTAANGAQSCEFRIISADGEANTDLGDLIASSIELMTTQLPQKTIEPDGIAVAYRSADQVQAIRTAVGPKRRELQLVPESAAALTYLDSTGEVAQFDTVALFDLGSAGLTVSVVDRAARTVLRSRRHNDVSGSAVDEAVAHHLGRGTVAHPELLRRARAAKEHLSTSESVTVELDSDRSAELSREQFDTAIGPLVGTAVEFTKRVIAAAPRRPDVVAVIGGGGNIPLFRTALAHELGIPVVAPEEPEAVIAKGAALLAGSTGSFAFPVVSVGRRTPAGTFAKVTGTLIAAFVMVGLIVGYGIQALSPGTPDSEDISPAVTRSQQSTTTDSGPGAATTVVVPIDTGAAFPTYETPGVTAEPAETYRPEPEATTTDPTTTTSATRTTLPTLRPAPDLPMIPWPEIGRIIPLPNQLQPPQTTAPTVTVEPNATPEQSAEADETEQRRPEPALPFPDTGSSAR